MSIEFTKNTVLDQHSNSSYFLYMSTHHTTNIYYFTFRKKHRQGVVMKTRNFPETVGYLARDLLIGMRYHVDLAEAFWHTQSMPRGSLVSRVITIENTIFDQQRANYLQNGVLHYFYAKEIQFYNTENINYQEVYINSMIFRMRECLYVNAHRSCWNAISTFPHDHNYGLYQLYWFLQTKKIPRYVAFYILEMLPLEDLPAPQLYITLPEATIKHVFSFLCYKEQVKLCSVSKNVNTLVTMMNSEYLSSLYISSGDDDVSTDSSIEVDGQSTDSSYTEE